MGVTMIRAQVKGEHVGEVEAVAREIFSILEESSPEGMQYAVSKALDGQTFVILLGLEGPENPLNAVPEYRAFLGHLKDWLVAPATQEPLTMVGSYHLF